VGTQTSTHEVRKGETLSAIARRYGMSLAELKRLNKLRSNTAKYGTRLTVTSSTQASASTRVKTEIASKETPAKETPAKQANASGERAHDGCRGRSAHAHRAPGRNAVQHRPTLRHERRRTQKAQQAAFGSGDLGHEIARSVLILK
jgi:LysM repeat protein